VLRDSSRDRAPPGHENSLHIAVLDFPPWHVASWLTWASAARRSALNGRLRMNPWGVWRRAWMPSNFPTWRSSRAALCCRAPGPQAYHRALPPEEAPHASPAIVTGCRQLSTIFVTVPLFIGSSWRRQTSYRSCKPLTLQDIFNSALEYFRVGTRIALQSKRLIDQTAHNKRWQHSKRTRRR
jgi:hypothetical protein